MKRKFGLSLAGLCLVLILSVAVSAASTDSVDMEFSNAPLADVFHILGELAGYNVLIDPSVSGTVSFYLRDLPIATALDLVSRTTGYSYHIVDNTLVIASEERLQQAFVEPDYAFIILEYTEPANVVQLLRVVFPRLDTYADAQHKILVLSGSKADVQGAIKLVKQYDEISAPKASHAVSIQTGEETLVTNSIRVEYADGSQLVQKLQELWQHRKFSWNPALGMLSAATTADEWKMIAEFITAQDVPDFVLKGIIQGNNQILVLIEYKGKTRLAAVNDVVEGWTLTSVQDKEAQFVKGERNFTVRMGR